MLYRSYAEPRWRRSALLFLVASGMFCLGGCATQNAQVADSKDTGSRLPIPCVKLPLLTFPLTNRPCSNNLLEKIIPDAGPDSSHPNW